MLAVAPLVIFITLPASSAVLSNIKLDIVAFAVILNILVPVNVTPSAPFIVIPSLLIFIVVQH